MVLQILKDHLKNYSLKYKNFVSKLLNKTQLHISENRGFMNGPSKLGKGQTASFVYEMNNN